MSVPWKDIGKKFVVNWALGGLLIGLLAVIVNFIKPELAGQLSGAVPFALTFTIITTFLLTSDRARTAKTSAQAILGGLTWTIYAGMISLLLYYSAVSFWVVIVLAFLVFCILTYLQMRFITLPEGFKIDQTLIQLNKK